MTFRDLGLNEPIVRAVAAQGYDTPTPIQTKAIPHVLAGRDVLGCAQTGTGKTGAFALPILHRLAADRSHAHARHARKPRRRDPRVLVLCPTRELAVQIFDSFKTYGKHLPLRHTAIFGGVNQFRQVSALRAGVDVLVATPGRLMDLMQQGHVELSAVETLVLDEADRMLDMGFIRDIRKIVAALPDDRQTLLFSATMPGEIRELADSILQQPVPIEATPVATPAEAIAQCVYMVPRANKTALLVRLIERDDVGRTLVFTRTKHGADKLVTALTRAGIHAHAMHSNKSQNTRTRALRSFKSNARAVMVATDIASRGIDVDEITHVFNYDLPNEPETYVHRIGRTARAGASGIAVAFCDREEIGFLRAIERLMKRTLEQGAGETDLCESFTHAAQAKPAQRRQSGAGRNRRQAKPRRSRSSAASHGHTKKSKARPASGKRGFARAGKGRRRGRAMAR